MIVFDIYKYMSRYITINIINLKSASLFKEQEGMARLMSQAERVYITMKEGEEDYSEALVERN